VTTLVVSESDGRWLTYAGGYSDMVGQRGRGVEARISLAVERPTKVAAAPRPPSSPKRKLSFKQQHALQTLPGRIAALEKQIGALKAEMASPDLFTRDPTRFKNAAAELEAAEQALTEAEHAWLEAELAREELDK